MCYSKAEGGQRCAPHALATLTAARARLSEAPQDPDRQQSVREAMIDYASTTEGARRLRAQADGLDPHAAAQMREILSAGADRRASNAAARRAARAHTDNATDVLSAGRTARILVGNDPATPPEILTRLAADRDPEVRTAVAGNPRCPAPSLEDLAGAQDWRQRQTVAANPAAPPQVLDWLAADQDEWVRCTAALNANTAPETLDYLARDPAASVRANVASNPRCDPHTLAALSRDTDPEVSSNARATRRLADKPPTPVTALPVPPPDCQLADVERVGLRRTDVDDVVVERAVAGEQVRLSASERFEVWRVLTIRGRSQREITERLKLSTETLKTYRSRLGRDAHLLPA